MATAFRLLPVGNLEAVSFGITAVAQRQLAEDQHLLVVAPVPMRIALVASVAIVVYMGFFPGAALDFARESVEGLASLTGAMPGLGE